MSAIHTRNKHVTRNGKATAQVIRETKALSALKDKDKRVSKFVNLEVRESRCSGFRLFVITHYNDTVANFRDWL